MKHILFVDDEINVLNGLKRMLRGERMSWEMTFVESGEEALELCSRFSFDVVVSDIRMPGMDGATLLSLIRERYPATSRIALSGYLDDELLTKALPVVHRYIMKPCQQRELQSAIANLLSLCEILKTKELRQVVGAIGVLPSPPALVERLIKVINEPDTSTIKIAELIEKDVSMSAQILHLANSDFFNVAIQSTSIMQAIDHLGLNTIRHLVLAAELFRAYVPNQIIPASWIETVQLHAQHTAKIASHFFQRSRLYEEIFTASLLHDIGITILASSMPEQYSRCIEQAHADLDKVYLEEEKVFGVSHAEVGSYLLGVWGLPAAVVQAVSNHHNPMRHTHEGGEVVLAVYISDLLSRSLGASDAMSILGEQDRINIEQLGLRSEYERMHGLMLAE